MCTPARINHFAYMNSKPGSSGFSNPTFLTPSTTVSFPSSSSSSSAASAAASSSFSSSNSSLPPVPFFIPSRTEYENTTEIARPLNSKGGLLASECIVSEGKKLLYQDSQIKLHVAAIVKRGKVLAMATNKLGNRSSGCGFGDFSIHAERNVVKELGDMSLLRGADMFVCRIPNTLYSAGKVGLNIPSKDKLYRTNHQHNHHHNNMPMMQTITNNSSNRSTNISHTLPIHKRSVFAPRSTSLPRFSTPLHSTNTVTTDHGNHHPTMTHTNHTTTTTTATTTNVHYSTIPSNISSLSSSCCTHTVSPCHHHVVRPASTTTTNKVEYSTSSKNMVNDSSIPVHPKHNHHHHHSATGSSVVHSHTLTSSCATGGRGENGIGKDFLYSRPCYDCELFLEKCMKRWGLRNVYYTTDMTIPFEYGMDKDKYADEMYRKIQERRFQAAKERRALHLQQKEEQRLHPRGRDIRREMRLARLIPDDPSMVPINNTNNKEHYGTNTTNSGTFTVTGSGTVPTPNTHNATVKGKSKSVPRSTMTTVTVASTIVKNMNTSVSMHPTMDNVERKDTDCTTKNTASYVTGKDCSDNNTNENELWTMVSYDENYNGSLLEKYYRSRGPTPFPTVRKKQRRSAPMNQNISSLIPSMEYRTTANVTDSSRKKHPYLSPFPVSMQQQRRRIRRKHYIHSSAFATTASSVTIDNCSIMNLSSVRSLPDTGDVSVTLSSSLPSSPSNRTSRSVTPTLSRTSSRSSSPHPYKLKMIIPYDDPTIDSPRSLLEDGITSDGGSLSECESTGRSSPVSDMSETSLTAGSQRSTPSHVSSQGSFESTLTLSLSIPSLTTDTSLSSLLSSSSTMRNGSTQSRRSSPLSLTHSGKHSFLSLYNRSLDENRSRTARSSPHSIGSSSPYTIEERAKNRLHRTVKYERKNTVMRTLIGSLSSSLINHVSSTTVRNEYRKKCSTQKYLLSFIANTVMMKKEYVRRNTPVAATRSTVVGKGTLDKFNMTRSNQDFFCIP